MMRDQHWRARDEHGAGTLGINNDLERGGPNKY